MSEETTRPTRGFFGLGKFVPSAIRYIKGDTGAQGPEGPQGPQGETGEGAVSVYCSGDSIIVGALSDGTPKAGTARFTFFGMKDGNLKACTVMILGTGFTVRSKTDATDTTYGIVVLEWNSSSDIGQSGSLQFKFTCDGTEFPHYVNYVKVLDGQDGVEGPQGQTGPQGPEGPEGPQGPAGDPQTPSDATPQMDGAGDAGTATTYARGDHRHPTDTTRQAVIADLAAIRSGAAAGATAVQPSELGTAASKDVPASGNATSAQVVLGSDTRLSDVRTPTKHASTHATGGSDAIAPGDIGAVKAGAISGESGRIVVSDGSGGVETSGTMLAELVNFSSLAAVATSGDYDDLTNKPTIPAAQVNADWNANSGVAQILNKPTIPDVSGKADSISLAPAFSDTSTYAVGDYVTHEGLLYKCTTAVSTAGAWNAANWTAVAVTDEMGGGGGGGGNLPYDAEVEYIEAEYNQYIDTGISANTIVSAYGVFMTPSPGQRFYFGARTSTDSGLCCFAFISTYGFRMSYGSTALISPTSEQTTSWDRCGFIGTTAFYNGASVSYTQSGTVTSLSAYLLGVNNNGSPLITATDVPLRIRSFRIETANGIARDFIAVRKDGVGCLYDRISQTFFYNAGTGSFAYGADIENLYPSLRYAFASPTPTVSGTSATVACEDRAINDFTVATGITSLTITPPAAVAGRARDFFCRVTLTDSSLPTVTLSGGTIDIGASEVAGMTQGVNLLMFTEIASGHWLASRRSAS